MIPEKQHAEFSASKFERIINCPGSHAAAKLVPPLPESEFAKEGTNAHFCAEAFFKHPDHHFEVRRQLATKFDAQMIQHAENYYRFVVNKAAGLKVHSEIRVGFTEEAWGSLDNSFWALFERLTVIDFKYGAGVAVNPYENWQLLFYATAIAKQLDYNFQDIEIGIYQPRMLRPAEEQYTGDPAYRSWIVPIERLMEAEKQIMAAVEAAKQPNAPRKGGDWCRWCPAKPTCPEISSKALARARLDFAPAVQNQFPDFNRLTPERLGEILPELDKLNTWIKGVKSHAFTLMLRGTKIPGHKLVDKRPVRKWNDAGVVATDVMRDYPKQGFFTGPPELMSPAQMEKVAGIPKAWVKERCSLVSSGKIMVPESDDRTEIDPMSDFGVID